MINVAVSYYSAPGNVHPLAVALAGGARQAGAQARLRRAPEPAPDQAIDKGGEAAPAAARFQGRRRASAGSGHRVR